MPNVFASPVGAAGRVYIPGREGSTVVLKHGPKLEMLAVNKLDDGFDASPALVDGEIYLRQGTGIGTASRKSRGRVRVPMCYRAVVLSGAWRGKAR